MSLADLAVAARTPGRLPADVDADLQVTLVYDGGQGGWAGGTHCAIVDVDVETGWCTSSATSWSRTAAS